MKKFLSLVLALVMTMSLVTISAGAKDFTDNDKVTYDEAVQVISLLGVVNGYEDGTFKPANTLTRGAAAKIICNLLLTPAVADTLPANNTGFKDVPSTNTFAKYIAYCGNAKIINGYSDGTFRPAATLTGFAFMKMLLGALGYDAQIEGFTGETFAVKVAAKVGEVGLAEGNATFVGTKAVTREEAALYAFNMLNSKMVTYASKGTEITVNGVTIIQGASPATEGKNTFAEVKFSNLKHTNREDAFGRKLSIWTYGKKSVTVLANDATMTYYGGMDGKTLFNDLGLSSTDTYDVNGTATKGSAIKANDGWGGLNTVVEVYYTEKAEGNDQIKIVVVQYYVGTVDKVTKAKGDDPRTITVAGVKYATDAFEKGDVVLYTCTKDNDKIKTIESVELAKSVEGVVTYSRGSKVTIAGTTYTTGLKDVTAGSEGTFYLGVDNSVVKFSGKKAVTSDNFAYIYNLVEVKGGVDEDGIALGDGYKAYFVKADGTKGSAMVAKDKDGKDTITKTGIIPYSMNADGEIAAAKQGTDVKVLDSTATKVNVGKSYSKIGDFYMTASTRFVFVDVDGKLTVTVTTGYKNVENVNAYAYVVGDSAGKALTVFVMGKVATAETTQTYDFLTSDSYGRELAADGSILYVFSVNGVEDGLKATSEDIFTKAGVKAGDRFSYTLKDGKLANVTKVEPSKDYSGKEVQAIVDKDYIALKDVNTTLALADDFEVWLYDATNHTFTADSVEAGDVVNVYTNGKTGADLKVIAMVITKEAEA